MISYILPRGTLVRPLRYVEDARLIGGIRIDVEDSVILNKDIVIETIIYNAWIEAFTATNTIAGRVCYSFEPPIDGYHGFYYFIEDVVVSA